ncbi:hypothetical protein C9374_001699 [Naegleria lovaniensis]|uniref:Rab family small GTPase n=1 Tax=Naegleria lovaniensis TaxID=51637 RepID=A0AA88GR63_NAELO|nr:uncharacterized protein C9374_001699 [Naegleria lovaniensis]KAG2387367.1 hypothetical protein C9374_001699 [Naegleria lovaniensis]
MSDIRGSERFIKAITIGNSSVGKSSLVRRWCGEDISSSLPATIGVDFRYREITLDDRTIKVSLFDTAGSEKFESLTQSYYRGSKIAFIVYDVTKKNSLEACNTWLNSLYKVVDREDVVVVLIGNKTDDVSLRKVTYQEGETFAKDHNIPLFFETSSLSNSNTELAFFEAVRKAYNIMISKQLSSSSTIQLSSKVFMQESLTKKTSCGC